MPETTEFPGNTTPGKSSPALVGLAWAVVSIPLVWGIYNTALNAAKLFTPANSAAGSAAASSGPAASTPGPTR